MGSTVRERSLDPSYPTQYSPSCRQNRRMNIEFTTALPREGSMTTATRLNGLASLSFGALAGVSLLALGSGPAMAGTAALTGTVSSTQEGKMEGVVISAK